MNISIITMAAKSMDYEQLTTIFSTSSLVLFILAAVCLALAVLTFITFKIPYIIGDLSGRTARKSIAHMREENEKSGKKSYRPHPVAVERGTLTEPIKQQSSGKLKKQKQTQKQAPQQPISPQMNARTPMVNSVGSGPTDILSDPNATQRLDYDLSGTEVLAEGTQVLSNEQIQTALNQRAVGFKMIQDIVLIHTNEVI